LQSIKIGIKGIKMIMGKKALLMILDGWGLGKHGKGDVIYNTPTPYLDYLNAVSSHSQLQASGENVGLPDGQMGNSEVGHLNIGAGRVVYQDLVKKVVKTSVNSLLKHLNHLVMLRKLLPEWPKGL